MKRLVVILGICLNLFFSQFACGQQLITDFAKDVEGNAFLLSQNSTPDTTSIAAGYKMYRGDFFSPISVSKIQGGLFETVSFLKVSKWNLYGGFYYENSFSDKSYAVLSVFRGEESPLFLFQNRKTESQYISYKFRTMASRKIFGGDTYLGLRLNYEGGSFYKKTDLRNTQNLLKIKSGVSVGKEIDNGYTVGVDLNMDWRKTKPSLSSVYQHAYDDESYKHYMNIGFGTLDKKPGYSFEVKTVAPNAVFYIAKQNDKVGHYLRVGGFYSSSVWENVLVKDINQFNKPYKYEQFALCAQYAMQKELKRGVLKTSLRSKFLAGNSYWRENNRQKYLQAYWNKKVTVKGVVNYERNDKKIRLVGGEAKLINQRLRDKNFGNSVNFTKLKFGVNTLFCFSPKSLLKPTLTLAGEYVKLLNEERVEGALISNNFMQILGNRLYDYWTAERIGATANLDLNLSSKKDLHFFINSSYTKNLTENVYENTFVYSVILGVRLNY